MTQQFIIPPRTTDGNEIRKFFQRVCQLINGMMDVDNSLASAYLAANQTINDNAFTKITLDTESFDLGSNFSAYKYTASIAGKYHFDFGAGCYDAASKLSEVGAALYLDGVLRQRGTWYIGPDITWFLSTGGGLVSMTAGQYLELYVYGNTSDSGTFVAYGGSDWTFLSVHLIVRD